MSCTLALKGRLRSIGGCLGSWLDSKSVLINSLSNLLVERRAGAGVSAGMGVGP